MSSSDENLNRSSSDPPKSVLKVKLVKKVLKSTTASKILVKRKRNGSSLSSESQQSSDGSTQSITRKFYVKHKTKRVKSTSRTKIKVKRSQSGLKLGDSSRSTSDSQLFSDSSQLSKTSSKGEQSKSKSGQKSNKLVKSKIVEIEPEADKMKSALKSNSDENIKSKSTPKFEPEMPISSSNEQLDSDSAFGKKDRPESPVPVTTSLNQISDPTLRKRHINSVKSSSMSSSFQVTAPDSSQASGSTMRHSSTPTPNTGRSSSMQDWAIAAIILIIGLVLLVLMSYLMR